MLRIGEFSELSSISIHMLRHYDKIGLLVPKQVDSMNGYRYYDKEQLIQANQILALKSMGFGLEEIKAMMEEEYLKVQGFLQEKLKELQSELVRINDQVKQIESILNAKDIENLYMLSIARKTIEPMNLICYRGKIASYPDEGNLWQLVQACKESGVVIDYNLPAMAVYHERDAKTNMIDVEVQLPIKNKVSITDDLFVTNQCEREVVSVIFKGGYSQIASINMAVATWLEQNAFEISGQSFAIYHNSPENCKDDKEFITELCFPIKKIN